MIFRTCQVGKYISALRLLQCRTVLRTRTATFVRSCPATSRNICTSHNVAVKLESWSFEVKTFSELRVNSAVDVTVSPTDPITYPEANKAFVYILNTDNSQNVTTDEGQGDTSKAEMYTCDVSYDDVNGLRVSASGLQDEDSCKENLQIQIEVPIKFNVDAIMRKNGKIHVIDIDNDHCQITTDKGVCRLTNVKTLSLNVSSVCGHVISEKSLHGNGEIRVQGSGCVTTDKLYGMKMDIYSESGGISTKCVYHDTSTFTSVSGDIKLRNLHGSSQVTNEAGNVTIDTLDGNLTASTHSGNIDVHVTRHSDVSLSSLTGDITVKLPESTGTQLEVQGRRVDIDDRLQVMTEQADKTGKSQQLKGSIGESDGKLLKVSTEGSVQLQCQSWLDTLNLSKSLTVD